MPKGMDRNQSLGKESSMLINRVGSMKSLTKEQAEKIAEIMSSIYQQGSSWVLEERDLDTGLTKLSRGLSERAARQKLKAWRKEKVELLLRSTPDARAYTVRVWQDFPHWKGDGVWQWAQKCWYTTKEDAEKAKERIDKGGELKLEVFETTTENIPGNFVVA